MEEAGERAEMSELLNTILNAGATKMPLKEALPAGKAWFYLKW